MQILIKKHKTIKNYIVFDNRTELFQFAHRTRHEWLVWLPCYGASPAFTIPQETFPRERIAAITKALVTISNHGVEPDSIEFVGDQPR